MIKHELFKKRYFEFKMTEFIQIINLTGKKSVDKSNCAKSNDTTTTTTTAASDNNKNQITITFQWT